MPGKMKKLRKLNYLIVTLLLLATGCFEEREELNKKWVAFDDARIEQLESDDDPIEVTISYSGGLRSSDIDVTYTISSPDGAVEGEDYELPASSGSVTIPAGEASVSFVAIEELIDNAVSDGARTVVLTLEDADGLTLGFPGPDGIKKSIELVIKDDDCPFDLNTLAGDYDVEIISEASFGNPAGSWFTETTISVGSTANTLKDINLWDFGSPGVITINPTTKDVTIEGVQFLYTNATGLARYGIQGTQPAGTVINNCGIFTVKLEVVRENQTTVANRSVIIYTKK
jgi:hypothetical protein